MLTYKNKSWNERIIWNDLLVGHFTMNITAPTFQDLSGISKHNWRTSTSKKLAGICACLGPKEQRLRELWLEQRSRRKPAIILNVRVISEFRRSYQALMLFQVTVTSRRSKLPASSKAHFTVKSAKFVQNWPILMYNLTNSKCLPAYKTCTSN